MKHSVSRRSRLAGGVLALATALVLTAVAAGPASAATLKVCPTGCPYTTIPDALAAAADGDTIQVGAGVYAGGFQISKSVRLRGAGANLTTISGGGPVIHVFGPGPPGVFGPV